MSESNSMLPRRAPVLGLVIIVFLLLEKMLAHTYTVIIMYVLPDPWNVWVPLIVGLFGFWLILKGMGKDEVKGTLLGLLGASIVWMNWFECGLPLIAAYNEIPMFLPTEGNMMAGLLGEHVILQSSGLFCLIGLFFVMLNKDVRCRMLIWIRRQSRLEVGKPTQGYRPNVARVAAFEYFFVTWFMYVVTLILVDPRLWGLYHPGTYIVSAALVLWSIYLMFKLTQQREVGLSIRYGIGAMGVAWFIPEILALYESFYEFYLYADKHPIAALVMIFMYGWIIRWIWKTPINPETQRSN
jgi:hypothetical protein